MRLSFTTHAQEKLRTKNAQKLQISKSLIQEILKNPLARDKTVFPYRAIGKLTENLSLCIIYKIENKVIKVVTFYPAEKGRYERKL